VNSGTDDDRDARSPVVLLSADPYRRISSTAPGKQLKRQPITRQRRTRAINISFRLRVNSRATYVEERINGSGSPTGRRISVRARFGRGFSIIFRAFENGADKSVVFEKRSDARLSVVNATNNARDRPKRNCRQFDRVFVILKIISNCV